MFYIEFTSIIKYTEFDKLEDTRYLKDTPCKYLKNTVCTINTYKPNECKSYPHTHKEVFISRTLFMIENYAICPIVYNVFERLKIETKFKH